jgi:hypothetical protein
MDEEPMAYEDYPPVLPQRESQREPKIVKPEGKEVPLKPKP